MDFTYQQFVYDKMMQAAEEAGCVIQLSSLFNFNVANMEADLERYLSDEEYEQIALDTLEIFGLI